MFSSRAGIESHDNGPFPTPQLHAAAKGQHTLLFVSFGPETAVLVDIQRSKIPQVGPSQLLHKVCRVRCDEMNAGVVVNAVDRFLRVHPFVEHDSQPLFRLVETTHHAEQLIDHPAEHLRIMGIALVDPVEKRGDGACRPCCDLAHRVLSLCDCS
jgi:hypothetical protein